MTAVALPSSTPVLIIGGGTVGLTLAVLLADRGVGTVVVERHDATSAHPRARGVNVRSMEILRSVGLEEQVRATPSSRALAGNHGIVAAESLTGRWFGGPGGANHRADPRASAWSEHSPTSWAMCDQDELEPLLARRARELGAVLAFGHEVVDRGDPEADEAGPVTVVERSTRTEHRIDARYVVAADGAHSPTRRLLGIGSDGPGTLGRFANVHFHADLAGAMPEERFVLCYIRQDGFLAALLPIDNADRWLLHVPVEGEWSEERHRFTDDRAADLVRRATGIADLAVDVKGVLPWESAGRVARTWRSGRILLAGDAAHVMPPTGAFGSNTGIADAHNLAWKLQAVLAGDADPALLDTYEAERRPVAAATVDQAVLRSRHRGQGTEAPAGLLSDDEVILGFRYRSAAVLGDPGRDGGDGGDGEAGASLGPLGSGEPGTRAPHLRRADGRAVLDLLGPGPVLLAGSPDWRAADGAGGVRTVVLDPVERAGFAAAYGVGPAGASLVRPDGVVGARWDDVPADPGAAVTRAAAAILGRPG